MSEDTSDILNPPETASQADVPKPKRGKGTAKPGGKISRPKGTQDLFGTDMARWHVVETMARTAFSRAGYQEIRTPIFESTDLFQRGVGDTTDIVSKEMYTFEKADRWLSLRPEGTAGVVRSYVEHGMGRLPKPVKLFYMGPMFRYERPQAGRQRQFHQIGLELFGLDSPSADAEAILTAMRFFESLNVPQLALELNNIGTAEDREKFKFFFRSRLKPFLSQLCEDCQTRYETNPLRMLDCKNEQCKAVYQTPDIKTFLETDFTSPECQAHFAALTAILDAMQIPYQRNFYLVRGLDYYTKTVFEITSTHLGAQNAVCGGGRYNKLVEELGGQETPAVGWALGQERLMALVPELPVDALDYYLVTDQHATAFQLADVLRRDGKTVEIDLTHKNFGKQLERAGKSGAKAVLILGEAERNARQVQHKTLGAPQTLMPFADLNFHPGT